MNRSLLILIIVVLSLTTVSGRGYDINGFIIAPWYDFDVLPNIDSNKIVWYDAVDSSLSNRTIRVYDLQTDSLVEIPAYAMNYMESPKIDGNYIIYKNYLEADGYDHFFYYDLQAAAAAEFAADYLGSGYLPGFTYPYAVFYNCSDSQCLESNIYYYDLSSNTLNFIKPYYGMSSRNPNADGHIAVWFDCYDSSCTDGDVYVYDLDENEIIKIIQSYRGEPGSQPAINGNYVAWWDYTDSSMNAAHIRVYDISADQIKDIHTFYRMEGVINVAGNYVIWADEDPDLYQRYIYAYDIETDTKITVSKLIDNYFWEFAPSCDGRYIVWADSFSLDSYSILGYDLQTRTKFEIAGLINPPYYERPPNINNGIVVWKDWPEGSDYGYIYAARIFNDSCFDAEPIVDNEWVYGDNYAAAGDMVSGCAFNDIKDVWYYYQALSGGNITVTLDGIDFDTTLAAYNACGGTRLACNDDYDVHSTDSRIDFTVVKGKTYYIRVAGFNEQMGSFRLRITRGTCTSPLKGDLNGDCQVNFYDFAEFCEAWLQCNLDPPSLCGTY